MAAIDTSLLGGPPAFDTSTFGASTANDAFKIQNYIQAQRAQQEEIARTNALGELYAKHYDPSTGDVNYNNLIADASRNQLTAKVVPALMGEAQKAATTAATIEHNRQLAAQEAATAAAKTQETESAQAKSALQASRSNLEYVNTPEQLLKWHESNHANPALKKFFESQGIAKDERTAELNATLAQPNGFATALDRSKRALDNILGVKPEGQTEFDKKWALFKQQYPQGTYEQFARLSQAPGTNITVKTGEEAATALAKTMGAKVADEMATLNNTAQGAVSNLNVSASLRPLLESENFISGTLAEQRLALAKALGLKGATETQAYFAGVGKQVAELVKQFGSGTSISNADREYAEKIAGGSIELTKDAIRKIIDLNDKYSRIAIDKHNDRLKFLARKNPGIMDYYDTITAPAPAVGAAPAAAGAAAGGGVDTSNPLLK